MRANESSLQPDDQPAHIGEITGDARYIPDDVLKAMATAAVEVLNEKQLEVFQLWADRVSSVDIASYLGLHKSRIGQILHGHPAKRQPGAIALVARHLQKDEAFMARAQPELEVETKVPDLSRWYAGHTLKPHLFVPLAVLMIADMVADKKRQVRVDTLMAILPRAAVEAGMHALRGAGYVQWDGITCTIVRTPVDEVQP